MEPSPKPAEPQPNLQLFNLPNVLTLLNLLCGILAINIAHDGSLEFAAYLILLGGVFDVFDGMAARTLKIKSEVGKQLDSLADVVTFGVAPAFILAQLALVNKANITEEWQSVSLLFLCFAVPLFAALRLAKFNVDTRPSVGFRGLPTPAAAIATAALPGFILFFDPQKAYRAEWIHFWTLGGYCVVICALMVSELPLLSLKGQAGPERKWSLALALGGLVSFGFMGPAGGLVAIAFYLLLSFIAHLARDPKPKGASETPIS